jgi:Putative peptidoglycan binding domain
MATASGDGKGTRRPLVSLVAYAIVLALLGWAGVALWTGALWTGGRGGLTGGPASDRAPPATSKAAPVEPADTARALKLPPRPAEPEATAPPRRAPAREPAVPASPSPSETGNNDPAAATAEKPEPRKTTCTVDIGAWPSDKTDQAKVIQILLRDLGFYSGTTYGTIGPATRAAIRKFQLAADEAETGEPSETLFESLRKKCAAP